MGAPSRSCALIAVCTIASISASQLPVDETSLLQTRLGSELLVDRIVPTDKIHPKRGKPYSTEPNALTPDQYTLSKAAILTGVTKDNALRYGGGGEEWKLFPDDAWVPEEYPGDSGPELMQVNDPADKCAAGDISGYSILSVSEPTVVPYIVPNGKPGRKSLAMIIAPGGGNKYLSWTKEGANTALWLNSLGISAFVLKYRVPTNSDVTSIKTLIDGQRAVSLIRSKFKELDLESVGMIGFSAGGFLAANTATYPKRSYKAIDKIDKESFTPDFSMMIYATGSANDPLGKRAITEHSPPTFTAIAKNDPCVKPLDAIEYYKKVLESGAHHEIHIYGNGEHGFGNCDAFVMGEKHDWKSACAWTLNAQLFMERQLGFKHPMGKAMKYDDEFAGSKVIEESEVVEDNVDPVDLVEDSVDPVEVLDLMQT